MFTEIYISKVKTPKAVITQLEQLSTSLVDIGLPELLPFNQAYIVVSRAIQSAQAKNQFVNSALMDALSVAFAEPYFLAINQHIQTGKLPKEWARVQRQSRRKVMSFALLRGAHTHIMVDLPGVLPRVILDPESFAQDYQHLNIVLLENSREISDSYFELYRSVGFLKRNLRGLYLYPVMRLIIHWRTRVWREFCIQSD